MSYQSKDACLNKPDYCVIRPAYSRCILGDRIQHRLDVSRRARDHAKNFTGRSLLLKRLLQFVKQADVLDGDDGLIGERFPGSLMCTGVKGRSLGATCVQRSDVFAPADEGERIKVVRELAAEPNDWEIVLGAGVGDVEGAMLPHPALLWRHPVPISTTAQWVRVWDQNGIAQNHRVPLAESQQHVIDPTNPRGALDDRVEDRLHVGGRRLTDASSTSAVAV